MAPRPRKRQKSPPKVSSAVTLPQIAQVERAGKAEHLKAANTSVKYSRNIRAARNWLEGHFKTTNATAAGSTSTSPNEPDFVENPEGEDDEDESFTHPDFRDAFNDVPNRFSARALALYISFKCLHEGKKEGTGSSVRAAFKHMWEQSCGTKYRGKWQLNPLTAKWEGNPVESAAVIDVMAAVKNKGNAEGGDRTHSIAMSARFMEKIYLWSMAECRNTSTPAITLEERQKKTVHLMYRAFSMVAWRIWARCFELVKLKKKHVQLNQTNEKAFNAKFHRIHLVDRKGWQRKLSKTEREPDLRSNVYHIYDDIKNELPGCNAYQALHEWVDFLEGEIYHRPLSPDDYIFPAMGANGIIQPGEPVSHDTIQKYIREFTLQAGVTEGQMGSFSTHCFRRGGAQYFHLFAPDGKRWKLRTVRWWGGWAEKEHRDTLIRYLLDELHSYEESYTDAQCPFPQDDDGNYAASVGPNMAPVTVIGMQAMSETMCSKMEDISLKFSRELQETAVALRQELGKSFSISNRSCLLSRGFLIGPLSAQNALQPPVSNIPYILHPSVVPGREHQLYGMPPLPAMLSTPNEHSFTLPGIQDIEDRTLPSAGLPTWSHPQPLPPAPIAPTYVLPPATSAPPTTFIMRDPGDAHINQSAMQPRQARPLPTHDLVIPDIPVHLTPTTRARRSDSWRWIVRHWTEGDVERGLSTPLKDWDRAWLRGANKELLAAKYGQRGVIAVEYLEQYNSDEATFLAAYPEAEKGHSALYAAIQKAREARGDLIRRERRR